MDEQKNVAMPPLTNRGAQNTYGAGLRACVDWVQATFPSDLEIEQVVEVLGFHFRDFELKESGMMGYKKMYICGDIKVLFDGAADMGIHVLMSGQACRQWEERSTCNWVTLFRYFNFVYNVKLTRLDVAIDDFKGYFTINTLRRKVKQKCVVSRFKSSLDFKKTKLSDASSQGDTLKLGSENSRIQVTFYDKKLERESKGLQLEEGLTHWVRTELRLRDERANVASLLIANQHKDIGELASGWLKNYVNFVDQSKDSNKSRRKTSNFWAKFLGDVEKIPLTVVAPDRTLQKSINWIDRQVSSSMATIYLALDEDLSVIHDLILKSMSSGKIDDEKLRMINKYRISTGKNPFTKDELIEKIMLIVNEQKLSVKEKEADRGADF